MAGRDTDETLAERMEPLLATLRLHPERVLLAIELAAAIRPEGKKWTHETCRKRVREVVKFARDDGHKICADWAGYWLARYPGEYGQYMDARKRGAKFDFVTLRKIREAATDRTGRQGKLFETRPLVF